MHSPKGDKEVELGAQWVHGVEGNVAYELAAPHGVLDKGGEDRVINMHEKIMDSDGNVVQQNVVTDVNEFVAKMEKSLGEHAEKNTTSPLGDYFKNELIQLIFSLYIYFSSIENIQQFLQTL